MKRNMRRLFLGVVVLLMVACSPGAVDNAPAGEEPRSGRILLWHNWVGSEAETLSAMIAAYNELNPAVQVISVPVEREAFVERFLSRSAGGLGPDLILANASELYELADFQQLRDLSARVVDLSPYLSSAVQLVREDQQLLALPFSAHTHVLFYNKSLVQQAPETISELVERVRSGEVFAQNTSFVDSYWGIGAYNGAIINEKQRLVFGQGGFENWLDFLSTAYTLSGFLLEHDQDALRSAFIEGVATYYVADSLELPSLVAAMGEGVVGVALLPSGPDGGVARPFLRLDGLAFSKVSSDEEFALAFDLANFLTSPQAQLTLATADLGRVPVNTQVRLTPNLPANTLTVARQARLADPGLFANRPLQRALLGSTVRFVEEYRQVVEGIMAPDEMIQRAFDEFSQVFDLHPITVAPAELCPPQPGTLTLWHALRSAEQRVLEELARKFEATCPGATIEITYIPYDQIEQQFAEAARAGGGPDVLFESSRWLATLAEEGLLLDLTEHVSPSILQQFVPNTVANFRYREGLYGIPESITVLALLLNRTQVSDPPIDLQQLAQSITVDRRIALPVGFFWGYWGMKPFGGFTFDSYRGKITETDGLVAWLEALQRIYPVPGVDMYFDFAAAEDAFAYEEAAYLVTGPWSLARLHEEVGPGRFSVLPLPNGPVGLGSPMLQTQGTMINVNASPLSVALALAFGQFVNLPESQQQFLSTESHVTASVTVDLDPFPNIAAFREQAKVASLAVENRNFLILQKHGDQLYRDVLLEGAAPDKAVAAFVKAVHAETGAE